MKNISIAFEGGGGKGAAYLSVIKALEEKKLLSRVKSVAGSSAGAINAFLFVLGYNYEELVDLIFKQKGFENFLPKERNEGDHIDNFYYRSIVGENNEFENYFLKWPKKDYKKYVEFSTKIRDLKGEVISTLATTVLRNPFNSLRQILKYKDVLELLTHKPKFHYSNYVQPNEIIHNDNEELKKKINYENYTSMLFFGGLFKGDDVIKNLSLLMSNKKIRNHSYKSFVPDTRPFENIVVSEKGGRSFYAGINENQNDEQFFSLDEEGELKLINGKEINEYNSSQIKYANEALSEYSENIDSYNAGRNQTTGYNTLKNNLNIPQVEFDSLGRMFIENVGKEFSRLTFEKLFEMTNIELAITGSNITNGETVIFSHKTHPKFPVIHAVAISMNLPLIWPPIYVKSDNNKLNGWYADGGIYNNLPVNYLMNSADSVSDIVLGFYLDEKGKYVNPFLPVNINTVGEGLFSSVMDRTTFDYTSEKTLGLKTSDEKIHLSTTNFTPKLELNKDDSPDELSTYIDAFEKTTLHKINYQSILEFLESHKL